jgi:hypothetical protein
MYSANSETAHETLLGFFSAKVGREKTFANQRLKIRVYAKLVVIME